MRAALLLLLLAVAGHAPMLARATWRYTEPFRALVAHEMVTSGDWLVPTRGGEVILTKPPLYYWILAVVHELAGFDKLWLRVPSVLLLWLAGLCVFRAAGRQWHAGVAWLAALGACVSPLLLWHGGFAEIDPAFTALSVISAVWLAENAWLDSREARGRALLAGLAGSLAMLAKGPPYLLFVAGILLLSWRRLGVLRLSLFALALAAPFGLVTWAMAEAVGAERFAQVAATESVGRVADFGWRALLDTPVHPLRALLVALPYTLWLRRAWPRGDGPDDRAAGFRRACTAGALGCVVILLFFPERPPRYMLAGVPLLAIGVAPAMADWVASLRPLPSWVAPAGRAVAGLGVLALLVLPWLPFPLPGRSFVGAALLALTAPRLRSRPTALAWLLLLPFVIVWTFKWDTEHVRAFGLRSEAASAAVMRAVLAEHGVERPLFWRDPGDNFAVELDPDIPWDTQSERPPADARWLIWRHHDGQPLDEALADFVERARVRGQRRDFVLLERVR
ncbi:MAG: glycosyltransferase family 39 protein [Planctomycetes bacterium]|nr:glycosyltransferase family 39 protein [Planctomycetota bacterium]